MAWSSIVGFHAADGSNGVEHGSEIGEDHDLAGQRTSDRICNANALQWSRVQEGEEAFVVTARDMTEAKKKTFRRKAR